MARTSAAIIRRRSLDRGDEPQHPKQADEPGDHCELPGGRNQRKDNDEEVEDVPSVPEVPGDPGPRHRDLEDRFDDEYAKRCPVSQVHPVAVLPLQRGGGLQAKQYAVGDDDGDYAVLEGPRFDEPSDEHHEPAHCGPRPGKGTTGPRLFKDNCNCRGPLFQICRAINGLEPLARTCRASRCRERWGRRTPFLLPCSTSKKTSLNSGRDSGLRIRPRSKAVASDAPTLR